MKIPITVIIITKDEEKNIERCLKSCIPASEIFIVDSNSKDNTKKIASKYLPKKNIINFKWNKKWPKKKYWSLVNLKISNEWVLMLDADEIPTKKFWKETLKAIKSNRYDAFAVPFIYTFMGKRLKFGDPVRKLILFKHKKTRYKEEKNNLELSGMDQEVHEHPIIKGKIGKLKGKIIHNDFKGMNSYIERHNKYSSWEAELINREYYKNNRLGIRGKLFGNTMERRRYFKNILMNNPFKPLWYFIYSYIIRLGFMDGKAGLYYNLFKSFYFLQVELKSKELKKSPHSH